MELELKFVYFMVNHTDDRDNCLRGQSVGSYGN